MDKSSRASVSKRTHEREYRSSGRFYQQYAGGVVSPSPAKEKTKGPKIIVPKIRIVNDTVERQRRLPSEALRHHTAAPGMAHLVQIMVNLLLPQVYNLVTIPKR